MKNLILGILSFFLVMFSSCATESLLDENPNGDNVTVTIKLPTEIRTRAFSDGSTFDIIKCYIYDSSIEDKDAPVRTETVAIREESGFRGGTLSLDLPSGKEYQMVFLATAGSVDSPDGKLYYNPTERTINVDYSKTATNDESLDCFFGVLPEVNKFTATYTVTLKRPYAQLNIGTSDLADYNELATAPLETVGVSVDGVYSSMNVMDGSVAGEPMKAVVAASAMPEGETFPVPDNDYLSMNYLIVDSRKDVAVTMTASNGVNTFSTDFAEIPLQRNYQTNIYGKLLTTTNDFKVEINPIFAGANNGNVDDYPDYDVVLEIDPDMPITKCEFRLYLNAYNWITKDILKFLDSNNKIKFSYSDLLDYSYPINDSSFIRITSDNIKVAHKIDFEKLGLTNINGLFNFSNFSGNSNLTECPAIELWDTSKVKNMSDLFNSCTALKNIDLSNLDTSNVTDMSYMFAECYSLESIDLSSLNTSKVSNMRALFQNCSSLKSINIDNIDTHNVRNMNEMFRGCVSLENLNLENFDTTNASSMSLMFYECRSLKTLDCSSFNTSNVKSMSAMFAYCNSLETVNLTNFDTTNIIDMSSMFSTCTSLKSLDFSTFNTPNLENLYSTFAFCESLKTINLTSLNTSKVTDMSYMFIDCISLKTLDISSFDTKETENMSYMFSQCYSLESIDLSNFDTSNVNNIDSMFEVCNNLKSIYLNFDLSQVKKISYHSDPFLKCTSLSNLCGTIKNLNYHLYPSDSPLDNASAMVFINGLAPVETSQTITFSKSTYDTLTDEQKAIATAKNWKIEYAN